MDQQNISRSYKDFAEEDYIVAMNLLSLDNHILWNQILVSLQQACEKYLKEVFLQSIGEPPNTHSLIKLFIPLKPYIGQDSQGGIASSVMMTHFYTRTYPNEDYVEPTKEDIKYALDFSTKVRNVCRNYLEALQRGRQAGTEYSLTQLEELIETQGYSTDGIKVYNEDNQEIGRVEKGKIYIRKEKGGEVVKAKRINYKDLHGLGYPYQHIYPTHQAGVKTLVDRIPKEGVEEVWLFGSLLNSSAGQLSDIDICIISDNFPLERTKGLWVIDGIGVDILIISKEEFEHENKKLNSVYREIKDKGVVIYDKRERITRHS